MVENHVMGQQERIRGGRDLRLDDRPEITVLPFDGVQVGACHGDSIQLFPYGKVEYRGVRHISLST